MIQGRTFTTYPGQATPTIPSLQLLLASIYIAKKIINKGALMRCLIKYIVIHCVEHIYIFLQGRTGPGGKGGVPPRPLA